jgi:hypothetical protein
VYESFPLFSKFILSFLYNIYLLFTSDIPTNNTLLGIQELKAIKVSSAAGQLKTQQIFGPGVSVPAGQSIFATISCPSGKVATGGGFSVFGNAQIEESRGTPFDSPPAWTVLALAPNNGGAQVQVIVECAP